MEAHSFHFTAKPTTPHLWSYGGPFVPLHSKAYHTHLCRYGGPFFPLHSKAFHTPPVHDEIGTHKQDMGQDAETEEVEENPARPHCGL